MLECGNLALIELLYVCLRTRTVCSSWLNGGDAHAQTHRHTNSTLTSIMSTLSVRVWWGYTSVQFKAIPFHLSPLDEVTPFSIWWGAVQPTFSLTTDKTVTTNDLVCMCAGVGVSLTLPSFLSIKLCIVVAAFIHFLYLPLPNQGQLIPPTSLRAKAGCILLWSRQ